MRNGLINTSKFVGTVGLGLLSGISYTLSALTLPSLLTLPTAHTAHQALITLKTRSTIQLRVLTGISGGALLLAFALAPRAGRHPYLLWSTAVAALGGGIEGGLRYMKAKKEGRSLEEEGLGLGGSGGGGKGKGKDQAQSQTQALDESVDEGVVVVNGEKVRAELEEYRGVQAIRAVASSLAFAMGVVGIWGDGF